MLRILHTADWHLGQTLRGHTREYEHETVLTALVEIVQNKEIDVLLIAGDVFDGQHPSGESQALFYRTLARLYKARPLMKVVIIAGYHDSGSRLEHLTRCSNRSTSPSSGTSVERTVASTLPGICER